MSEEHVRAGVADDVIVAVFFPVALALKGIDYEYKAVHVLKDGGEQV